MLKPGVSINIDLGLAPLHVGQAGANRHLARNFFFVVIGGGRAIVHAAQARGCARGKQHGRDQRGFAGVPVAHHGNVANVCAFINFHGVDSLTAVEANDATTAENSASTVTSTLRLTLVLEASGGNCYCIFHSSKLS